MCLSAFNVFLYALFCHFFCSGHFFSHFKLTYFLPNCSNLCLLIFCTN